MENVKRNVMAVANLVERLLRDPKDYSLDNKIRDIVYLVDDHDIDTEEAIRLALKFVRVI